MSTKSELLKLLDENCGTFVSGQKIGSELGISRAAINKAAAALKKSGYKILSRPSRGYMLLEKTDLLNEESVGVFITKPHCIKIIDQLKSTNRYAKSLETDDMPIVIVSDRDSETGSESILRLSILFKPDFILDEAPFITLASGLAVCHAIDSVCGTNTRIKWVNDIYSEGKRISSFTTEAQTNIETGRINNLIIGVSINCFPTKKCPVADGSDAFVADKADAFSRSALAGTVAENILSAIEKFRNKKFIPEYKRRCFILGKNIYIHPLSGADPIKARAIDIGDNGGLVIEYMEGMRMREIVTLTSGEVSLRE